MTAKQHELHTVNCAETGYPAQEPNVQIKFHGMTTPPFNSWSMLPPILRTLFTLLPNPKIEEIVQPYSNHRRKTGSVQQLHMSKTL